MPGITLNTIQVFDMTLTALADSGKAPLSPDLQGEMAQCPKAVEAALSQLYKVESLCQEFSGHMEKALGDTSYPSPTYIKTNTGSIAKSSDKLSRLAEKLHDMVGHFTIE